MFKLKHLKISKFRNVVPGTELVFNDGINVLLGQNGTGKTTLLKLISMVVRGGFSELKEESFELSYELASAEPPCQLSVQVAYAPSRGGGFIPGKGAQVQVATSASAEWSAQVNLELEEQRRLMFNVDPLGATLVDSAAAGQRAIPVFAPTEEYFILRMLLTASAELDNNQIGTILRICGNITCQRFDESLVTFAALTSEATQQSHGPPRATTIEWARARPTLSTVPARWELEGITSAARSLIGRLYITDLGAEELRLRSDELPFLQEATELMKFRSAELRLTRVKREVKPDSERVLYGDFKFYFTDEDDSQISHDYLSYGQKRLLAFLFHVDANPYIIIADELVNGMHHEWIEACRDAIGERQAFLTSQNPLLLDYLFFKSAEETRRTFLLCSTTVEQGQRRLRWGNLPAEDAADFFRAYEVGLQHVSAILRTKGLW